MTNPVEERAYRLQRRFIFAITIAIVVLFPVVWLLI